MAKTITNVSRRGARGAAARRASSVAICSLAFFAAGLSACTLQNESSGGAEESEAAVIWRNSPAARSFELWNDPGDNLLQALAEVEDNDAGDVLPINNSILGSVLGEVGAYYSAITIYQPFGDAFEPVTEQCEDSVLPDAIEEFCGHIMDDEQLVFVNELPHAPHTRTVVRKALSCARDAGFGYLAVEDLEEDDADLMARGYVSRSQSGRYTREPQLARVIEEAMGMGYQIVSYAVDGSCDECGFVRNIREHAEEQASILVEKTLESDPEGKVLVLAGPRQSYKEPWGDELYTTSIANYAWQLTDVEPYAVEQVSARLNALPFGESDASPQSGMYLASGPDNGRCAGSYFPPTPNAMPALNSIVVHVPPRNDTDRWNWLHASNDERMTVTTSCESCEADQRLLVQAFPAGVDVADRVPRDQALCASGVGCQLVLPPAQYQVVVWSEGGPMGSGTLDLTEGNSGQITVN